MESNLQVIRSLYQKEIDAYKRQIDELRAQNKSSDEKNNALLDKVRSLNDLIEQAHVANKDLHTAFEHIREENRKLKVHTGTIDNSAVRTESDDLALETCQRQYINIARESVSWISEKDKLYQRLRFLERECDRYSRDNVTLGKQVRHLLRSLEEERGMIVRRSNQVTEYGQSGSALDVIDNHLVTFESIEELQNQNQKLLSLVKELSKKEEDREIQLENAEIKELNSHLSQLKSELDTVKGDRERIMTAFNIILKERDLFKILLCKTRQVEHMTPEIFQRMVSIACQSGPAIAQAEDTQDKDAHIVDLKAMISKLENELTSLREEVQKTRVQYDKELRLKTELLEEAHLKILTESKEAENVKEKNQVLETNLKAALDEYHETRTKLLKTTFEIEQEKQKCKDITNDYVELRKELEKVRVQNDKELRLQTELVDLKAIISRLESEVTDLREDLERARKQNDHELRLKTELLEEAHLKILSESQEAENIKEKNQALETDLKAAMNELQQARNKLLKMTYEIEQEKQKSKDVSDHYLELRADFFEVQRLRNIERLKHLELSKSYFKLKVIQEPPKSKVMPEMSSANVEETKKEEKRDAPPVRGIVLKRRKIV